MIVAGCSKHGRLDRKSVAHISGERPEVVTRWAFFAGRSMAGGPRTAYPVLRKLDGTEERVSTILSEAIQAWRREFGRLGYATDWLVLGHRY